MSKFWALVGLAFGLLSVLAGTRVLAGIDRPDYVVLRWLVVYNVIAGLAGVAAAAAVWIRRAWGPTAARLLTTAHAAVLVALVGMRFAGADVASDSLAAMTLRTVLWLVIAVVAARAARAVTDYRS